MMMEKRIIIMALKPKYAEAIYSGEKRWEFRKVPPLSPRLHATATSWIGAKHGLCGSRRSIHLIKSSHLRNENG